MSTWREQLDAIVSGIAAEKGDAAAALIRAEIVSRYVLPQTVDLMMNMALRETWRHEHGTTEEWDRAAVFGRVDMSRYERITPA